MNILSKKLPKSQLELTIEVPFDEIRPYLEKAAEKISKDTSIPGFRPGNVPYNIIKQKIGEEKILEIATPEIIKSTLLEAFLKENLKIIGEPNIDIEKVGLNQPLIYKALVSLLPKIKLNDYRSVKIKRREVETTDDEIEKTLKELQNKNGSEVLIDREVRANDKVEINLTMYQDNIPLEDGNFINEKIIIGEKIFPKEFDENLIGMGKNEEKEFDVQYSKDHFDKKIAGKKIQFKVKVNNIYERILPEINDEFAKSQGDFQDIENLRQYLKSLILRNKRQKEEERLEAELIDKLIEFTEFDDIPNVLIEAELEKMINELEMSVNYQGGEFNKYLEHIKKTKEELKNEFKELAEKRIKGALLIRSIADAENIRVENQEINDKIDKILTIYKGDKAVEKNINSEEYRNYIKNILINRKTIDKLKASF